MKVATLASSSRGNCTVVCGDNTKILIDAGICLKDIEARLKLVGVNPAEINAILVTHEHSDHIKGIGAFMRKYKNTYLVVCMASSTAVVNKIGNVNIKNVVGFEANQQFKLGEFMVQSFSLPHDCASCVGYSITKDNKKISIATDFGHTTTEIVEKLYNSSLVILESNHDEAMLKSNPHYTAHLKRRILGSHGHISNNTAAQIVCELAQNNVPQVVLAHLSPENNTPELAYSTICNYLQQAGITPGEHIKIDVANRFAVGNVFEIK